MEYLNTMYNTMKKIARSVVPQVNVGSNLPVHVNPSKRGKIDPGVEKSEYRLESVRLKSFEHWPCSWMTGKSLAEAGLYYTGTEDTVKCFDCDIELTEWKEGADPMIEHKQSSARCRFTRNIPCGNVPIGTDPSTIPPVVRENDICGPYSSASRPKHSEYVDYEDRYASFAKWPERLSHLKKTLAAAGLFYTGNLDETICFQCGGELRDWEWGDDPWEKHAEYHENCSYVRKIKGTDWVNKTIERMRNTKLIPKHSEYVDYENRYASFAKWPEGLSHLKKTLAAAGLFYRGNLDETICFQCGGGLKKWESGNDPWEEHAKRHQNCSYVRRAKGSYWVNHIIERMRTPKLETVESSTNDKLDEQFKEAENTGAASGSSQNAVIKSTGFSVASAEGSNKEQSIATTSNKKQDRVGVKLCKFCGIRKLEIIFLPCGHIVACAQCVRNMSIDDAQLKCNFCHKAVVRLAAELTVPVPGEGFDFMMPKMLKLKR